MTKERTNWNNGITDQKGETREGCIGQESSGVFKSKVFQSYSTPVEMKYSKSLFSVGGGESDV